MSARRRRRVFYTRAAERDLVGIAAYTRRTWGEEQAERYLTVLEHTCERILPEHHRLAREIEERPGIFRWRVERHVVFLRKVDDGIEIIRILHERMLPARHL